MQLKKIIMVICDFFGARIWNTQFLESLVFLDQQYNLWINLILQSVVLHKSRGDKESSWFLSWLVSSCERVPGRQEKLYNTKPDQLGGTVSMAGPCYKSMDNKSDFIITLRQRISSVALKDEKCHTHILCVHKIRRGFSADAAGDGDAMHTTLTPN